MSKLGTYTQEELRLAQEDYWFQGDYITLESGNRVSKAEFEQALIDFWSGTVQPGEESATQKLEFVAPASGHYTMEEFEKAQADFWEVASPN